MIRFDPQFVASLTYEAGRALKAIRAIQALEQKLDKNFPKPDEIKSDRKPYDLFIGWHCATEEQVAHLKDTLAKKLKLDAKWHDKPDGWVGCRSRVILPDKTTLNVHLGIRPPWHETRRY